MYSILFDHHIIPKQCRDHKAFRDIAKETFDFDSPANRIYLPADQKLAAQLNVSPHPGRHLATYSKSVCEALDQIETIDSPSERVAEIGILIDALRVGFVNGDLYTNLPIGKTPAEADAEIRRVLKDHKAYLAQYPDQLRAIRDLEQRGANAALNHLIKWLPYLDNPERQKALNEVIARNPDVNLTSGNRDRDGTPWSKFEASDPSSGILRIPGSIPLDPRDSPQLPGYSSPSLAGLDEQEGFTGSDPRFTRALPPSPTPDPNELRLGQLPPTTAAPADPLVLRSDPHSGTPDPYHENPLAGGTPVLRNALPWLAGAAAVGAAAPLIPAWLLTIGGTLALARAVNAQETDAAATMGDAIPSGGVLSAGAPAHNAVGDGLSAGNAAGTSGSSASSSTIWPRLGGAWSVDPEVPASTLADRFGNWVSTSAGTMPARDLPEGPPRPHAGSVAPEDVRRLTRANASAASSVFSSGSAPVPFLPSTEFSEQSGSWSVPVADSRPAQMTRPTEAFADEPSYLIQPAIFGVDGADNPRNDTEEWFSRWIRPLFGPE